MSAQAVIDRTLSMTGAAATPLVALLIDTHVISATVGVDIGAIVAAIIGGYHGGRAVERRTATNGSKP